MKATRYRRPIRFAFTLIELLVVIAIIGILASMLLPSLSRSKMKTKIPVCQNNQRQLVMSMRMYSEDSGRWVNYYSGSATGAAAQLNPTPNMPGSLWIQDFKGLGAYTAPFVTWMDMVYPYIGSLSVFRCGAIPPGPTGFVGIDLHHYGYNGYIGGHMLGGGRGFTSDAAYSWAAPEKVIVTADYNNLYAHYMNAGDWGSQAQNPVGQGVNHAKKHLAVYRHDDRSIVSFADGSVSFAESSDISFYGAAGISGHFDPNQVR